MTSFKVLLFDLDDTLIYFKEYWKASLLEAFKQHELTKEINPNLLFSILWEQNQKYEQLYHNKEITIQQFRNNRFIDTLSNFGKHISEEDAEDFNILHNQQSRRFMQVKPDLIGLLSNLSKFYELGIVTNGTKTWQYDKINAMGINSFFRNGSIFISEEVGYEKPSAHIYLKALDYFQAQPQETVFIGDSWINDVEGPCRVGMNSIWINNENKKFTNIAGMIGSVNNVLEIIKFLEGNLQSGIS